MLTKSAINPLTGKQDTISSILMMLSSQEGCDGEPYDLMQLAAEYIRDLECELDSLKDEYKRASRLW